MHIHSLLNSLLTLSYLFVLEIICTRICNRHRVHSKKKLGTNFKNKYYIILVY